MNWFMFVSGILLAGAMLWEMMVGSPKLALVYLAYAIANFTLATIKG